jgi:uncharacterized protein (UPF0332 family)
LTDEIRQRLVKARRLIRIARGYDPEQDPDGVAHHAYYAMYNAATAVLLARQGTVPKTHASIVGQFGLLVKDMPGKGRDHGRALREGFELRLLADYDAGATGLAERARASLDAAVSLVAFAAALIRASAASRKR